MAANAAGVTLAKGIRVSQLAKELGVKSKDITDKLAAEDMLTPDGKKYAASSTVSVGLSMTVREWFAGVEGGETAVETAEPVKAEVKTRVRRKKAEEDIPETEEGGLATAVAEMPKVRRPAARRHVEEEVVEEAAESEADVIAPEAPAIEEPTVGVPEEAPIRPAAEAPAPVAEPEAPRAPAARLGRQISPTTGLPEPTTRPTITLADKQREIQERIRAEREARRQQEEPITPAPQLERLAPAEISGPKIVRVEAPDLVPAPRKRRETEREEPQRIPTGPISRGGGGVKVTTDEDDKAGKSRTGANKSLSLRRRGVEGRRGEALEKLREFTEADLIARRDALNAARANRNLLDRQMVRTANKGKGFRALAPGQREGAVEVHEPITVKSLSAELGIKSGQLIKALMNKQGVFVTANQGLSSEQAESLALEFGIEIQIARRKTAEERLADRFSEIEGLIDPSKMRLRPPVVTILGHVDHGKTSLLDKIRHTNVVAGEAGGITQHVAAFDVTVERDGRKKQITFIDTPGHQAFTAMRARGAQVTDLVVLVVDVAQGVQPQTVESINHARAAGVPIVVAMNKIDRPDANPDKVLGELASQNLNPAEWGGDTEVVRTSAMTGQGIENLLEILDLQAELMELKASTDTPARGRVLEARMNQGLGPVATVLVQQGTLKLGDVVLAGRGYGRVRALQKASGEMVKQAGPSQPVLVSGFSEVPAAGDAFWVLSSMEEAEAVAEERHEEHRRQELAVGSRVSLETLFETVEEGKIKTINLIIKGDVQGSVETLNSTIGEQNTTEVRVKVIHSAVGAINESDVELADASEAVIIGFHVGIDESARHLAEQRGVEIRTYNVIYEIFDDIKKALSGMLEPEIKETYQGTAEVRAIFKASRVGTIAGCYVTDGHAMRSHLVRLMRDGAVVAQDLQIASLRRLKDDVREVKAGLECGVNLLNYDDVKEADKLEFYTRQKVARTL